MSEPARTLEPDAWTLKMKDLCDATGLPRQVIHFYIQKGLLPPGKKTGRNMAWYTEEHLTRLRWIKRLQHERFLPLKAIKALLDDHQEFFAPEQEAFLTSVRERLSDELAPHLSRSEAVDVDEVLSLTGSDRQDLEDAIALEQIGAMRKNGKTYIASEDVWRLELFSQVRALGFTRERGFTIDVLGFYEDAISKLFQQEAHLISSRLSEVPPDEAADMIERVIPIIHTLLTRLHESKVRDFFANPV